MACDLCNCDDHVNKPCPTCKNCIGYYVQTADYNKVYYDFNIKTQKPRYRYNGSSGKITKVIENKKDSDTPI